MNEKSVFNFIIQHKDGTSIDLHEDKNIWVSSFRIFSPTPDHATEKIDGRHGLVLLETTLQERKAKAKFSVEAVSSLEFDLLRDDLFRMFNPLNKFYIIRDLQPGKRMEVSVNGEFDLEYITLEDGEFEVEFILHSPFLESAGTTLSPSENMWQVGEGLLGNDVIYQHNTSSFRIFNAGDIAVDPRIQPLKITFRGESNGLTIRNTTTNEEWIYTGASINSDTIVLDGIRSFKNDESIFKFSNYKTLSLIPGFNDFEIIGANGPFEISFDFRFYYL